MAEVRALRAARDALGASLPTDPDSTQPGMAAAAEMLVSDVMGFAREYALETEVATLKERNATLELDLQAALTETSELLRNPLWETEVPEEEWRAELAEKDAIVESLLEEHAAMEGEIVSFMGEKQAMEAALEKAAGEKKAVQNQLNMIMVTMSDSDNRLHEVEQEKERLEGELRRLKAATAAGNSALLSLGAEGGSPTDQSELMDEIAHMQDEVARLQEDVAVLTQQLMAKTSEKSQVDAEMKALQVAHEELQQLMEEMQQGEGEGQDGHEAGRRNCNLSESLDASLGGRGGSQEGMVSTLLLEEFQEQHLEERAEWDAQRSRLEAEIAELREWRQRQEGDLQGQGPPDLLPSQRGKGGKEPLAPSDWHLVQVTDGCEVCGFLPFAVRPSPLPLLPFGRSSTVAVPSCACA